MKKYYVLIISLVIVFVFYSSSCSAQELSHGSCGFTAAVNGSQADLLVPIWLGNSNTLAPAIGVAGSSSLSTDLSAGLVFHHYIKYSSNFSPIIGARAGAIFGIPKTGTGTTDGIVGLLGGGEYFFSSNFSVGIEVQLNLTFSDNNSLRFSNPGGTNYNTGSLIYASVYF